MASNSNELARMRLLLQSQNAPKLQTGPVDSIGAGISQAAGNTAQFIMQRRAQEQLMQMMTAEQQKQQELLLAKKQAYIKAGFSPEQADVAIYDDEIAKQIQGQVYKASELNKNADRLVTIDPNLGLTGANDPNFGNLGYQVNRQQALAEIIAANDGATGKLAEAGLKPTLLDIESQTQSNPALNPNTISGSNLFRTLNGFEPLTEAKLAQEQATLMNTLLQNQNQSIVNRYLPTEKGLGVNREITEQSFLPLEKQLGLMNTEANIRGTNAGTIGKGIENEQNANELALQTQIANIATDDKIPVARKAALVSTLSNDPQVILQNLKILSSKEGVLGNKSKDFAAIYDIINKETVEASKPKSAPAPTTPKPKLTTGQQAGVTAKTAANALPTIGSTLARQLPVVGPALQFKDALGSFGKNIQSTQKFLQDFGQGFSGKIPQAKPSPKRQPTTIQGIQGAKKQANANAAAADQRIQTRTQMLNQSNQAVTDAEKLLTTLDAKQQGREKQLRQIFLGQ